MIRRGPAGQCARDANALPLAAGEFERVALHILRAQADLAQQRAYPILGLALPRQTMDQQRFGDGKSNGQAGI